MVRGRLSPRRILADGNRKANYGLTREFYDALIIASCGRCALCDKPCELMIDHCNATKVVRGLVCDTCNNHLKYLERYGHDQQWFERASDYLKRRPNPTIPCGCGCGALFTKFNACGRERRYVLGHSRPNPPDPYVTRQRARKFAGRMIPHPTPRRVVG
jgi:hypothetical protein